MNENSPAPDFRELLISVLIILLLVFTTGGIGLYVFSDPGIGDSLNFARVALKIRQMYPSDYSNERLIAAGRQGMFDRLDRYSGYVEQAGFDRMNQELSGKYPGIGVSVMRHDQGLIIVSVRENGPASEAGLLAGDVIIACDSYDLGGLTASESASLLRGPEGSDTKLNLIHAGVNDTVEVVITRRSIPLLHIPYAGYTADSIVYIRLLDFDAGASDDVRAALDSLIGSTARITPKGIIIDLRGNPGGLFREAHKVADLFLDEGKFIVGTNGRSRWNNSSFYSTGYDLTDGLPLAVLVDRGSASSSEIVAGAVKFAGRGILVGDTTFGKGLVQGFVRFPDGDGLRLTQSRYYFGDGVYLNEFDSVLNDTGRGLAPDHYFEYPNQRPFLRAVENSMVLYRFAERYHQEILDDLSRGEFDDVWIENLEIFALENGFIWRSERTQLAWLMGELADFESGSRKLSESLAGFLKKSWKEDDHQFYLHSDYIKRRIKRIVIERSFGTWRAYDEVEVKENAAILFASSLLRSGAR